MPRFLRMPIGFRALLLPHNMPPGLWMTRSLLDPSPKSPLQQAHTMAQSRRYCSAGSCLHGSVMSLVAVTAPSSKECGVYIVTGLVASLAGGITHTDLACQIDEFLCARRMSTSYCLLFQLGKKRQDGVSVLS